MQKVAKMKEIDLCTLVSEEAKVHEEKQAVREKQERFGTYEDKVRYIIGENYKPKTHNYGDLDPVESCLLDTFVDVDVIRRAKIDANTSDDSIKKTLLFDVLVEITGCRKETYDLERMSMKRFSQYFALQFVQSAMEGILASPEDASKNTLFEAMTKSTHRSQVKDDDFYDFRKPNPICELVTGKYLSLFKYKKIKENAVNAKNIYDLKYLLVTDIYFANSNKELQEKALEYLAEGQAKKAAVYLVLQSVKDDLFF